MGLFNRLKQQSLIIGLMAMILLVLGTLVTGGSSLQKWLFIIGAPTLGLTALWNKQKMFVTLQTVITVGAILAFFNLHYLPKYTIMSGSGIIGVAYLTLAGYSKEDPWWPLAGLGLLAIAVGFATNPVAYPILFNALLGFGGILVALYSAIGLLFLKVRIAAIWLVLNIIFAINPLRIVFS